MVHQLNRLLSPNYAVVNMDASVLPNFAVPEVILCYFDICFFCEEVCIIHKCLILNIIILNHGQIVYFLRVM